MMYLPRFMKPIAAAAALSVALVACGSSDAATGESDATPSATTGPTADAAGGGVTALAVQPRSSGNPFADAKGAAHHVVMAAGVLAGGIDAAADLDGDPASPAAQLRATLTHLLQEHVYLAGYAVTTGLSFGLDSAEFQLAADTLDQNSVALADAVGSLAGADNRDPFLNLWRQHIGNFVTYTQGKATGDEAMAQEAQDALAAYTGDAGAFFATITAGALPADAVAENLKMHISTLSAAIDAAVAGDPGVFDTLKAAADHVVRSAEVLSGGIASALSMEGDVSSAASGLHSGLTALLQEHVYLAGIAVRYAYSDGLDSDLFAAAAATLDTNSVAIAEAVGSIAGEQKGAAFLDLWRAHIGHFVDYAVAVAGDDDAGTVTAIDALATYTGDSGAFFAEITGGALPADAVADSLREHIATLAGAIDSLAAVLV